MAATDTTTHIRNFSYDVSATFNDFCLSLDDHGDKMVFKPMIAAHWFKSNCLFLTDRNTKILYYYDPDAHKWSRHGETYLHSFLAASMGTEYKQHHYINVLDSLKAITYDTITFSNKIACENGLLDPETGTLEEFTPNEMPFYSIPAKYDPAATAITFENFVFQVVSPDDALLMQEWAGYCLLPSYQNTNSYSHTEPEETEKAYSTEQSRESSDPKTAQPYDWKN